MLPISLLILPIALRITLLVLLPIMLVLIVAALTRILMLRVLALLIGVVLALFVTHHITPCRLTTRGSGSVTGEGSGRAACPLRKAYADNLPRSKFCANFPVTAAANPAQQCIVYSLMIK